jgi:hypothetical protein
MTLDCIFVGGGVGEFCYRQSDSRAFCVVDRVESLKEGLAEDEVESRSTRGANISNNQIKAPGGTANKSVEVTRPDLSVTG